MHCEDWYHSGCISSVGVVAENKKYCLISVYCFAYKFLVAKELTKIMHYHYLGVLKSAVIGYC
jgi:hypothetical protein